jgi:hypothetical protein
VAGNGKEAMTGPGGMCSVAVWMQATGHKLVRLSAIWL